MKPRILILITPDPRISPRVAEAVRVAAGVSAWGAVEVAVVFHGAAVAALADGPDEFKDGDQLGWHLSLLAEHGCAVYAPSNAPGPSLPENPRIPVTRIDPTHLGALTAGCRYLLRFD